MSSDGPKNTRTWRQLLARRSLRGRRALLRFFRLWEKKRGKRRSGSPLLASVGEAMFSTTLLFVGAISAAALITAFALRSSGGPWYLSGWSLWLVVAVIVSLLATGASGLVRTLLRLGTSAERRAALAHEATKFELLNRPAHDPSSYPAIPSDADYQNSPGTQLAYRLPSQTGSAWRLLVSGAFALVWNVVAAVLGVLASDNLLHSKQENDWFLIGMAVLFSAAGVASIYVFLRQLLQAAGVGPTSIEISDHPLRPGGRYEIYVSQAGRLKVKSMDVQLVCEEETTYHQGTDVRTERVRVYAQLVSHRDGFEIKPNFPFGFHAYVEMPASAMHSFKSDHSSVQWKFVIHADLVGWPPLNRSFPVLVYPLAPEKTSA